MNISVTSVWDWNEAFLGRMEKGILIGGWNELFSSAFPRAYDYTSK